MGFEFVDKGFTRPVDIVRCTCSCKSLKVKGIPCPHGVASLHCKKYEPIHYVDKWYNKETYLRTYEYFIRPMNNMNMCPPSSNPIFQLSVVKKLYGRQSKSIRKDGNETKKTGKLSKCGVVMTCSNFHTKGHDKKGCPTPPTIPSQIARTSTHNICLCVVFKKQGKNK
ncbi:hypothetical protein RDI58_026968 [Solanum bulbocastanum]|uniref:SWIM-type domain-containing protein n=1 Tax=Solanum bulbocastanum TaxID=147425 RepID=A0AAN8SZZ4_SOLBU